MPAIKFILSILFFIMIASFAVQNMGSVEISYYDFKFQLRTIKLSLMVMVGATLIFGFFIAWFLGIFERFKLKSKLRKQSKSIFALEEELGRLRNTPQLPVQAESSADPQTGSRLTDTTPRI